MKPSLNVARVRELLHYEPSTGVFTWRSDRSRTAKAGDVAGGLNKKGRRMIGVDGKDRSASRLAWLYMTGEWPEHQVDHEDRNKLNDAWGNLRPATNKQNCENRGLRSDNKSGVAGVWFDNSRKKKWRAKIGHKNKQIHLGGFPDLASAIAAKAAAERALFIHGRSAA